MQYNYSFFFFYCGGLGGGGDTLTLLVTPVTVQDHEFLAQLHWLHRLKKIQEKNRKVKQAEEARKAKLKEVTDLGKDHAANLLEDAKDEEIVFDWWMSSTPTKHRLFLWTVTDEGLCVGSVLTIYHSATCPKLHLVF